MVERKPGASEQAVGIAKRYKRAEPIGKVVEIDFRICKLRLRCQRPASGKPMRLPLSALKA
jgi:hypothetical protein